MTQPNETDQQQTGPNDTMVVNAQFQFYGQFQFYENRPRRAMVPEPLKPQHADGELPVHSEPLS
ncbi:hypothetical protein [Streptomyces sp. NBC_01363]|uniref:hypothetical protein n=1 Tax=Streptomyces sp. NBC_01363 TaxID=2903840 RepID=UPI00224FDFDF|nr:hypothetical protein [Streptomyces sp. NBC_01363]MCX4732491.1 hypothetical protein [Streptomyces sp. NBC_01363]